MDLNSLKETIRARHTLKVLADPDSPWETPGPDVRDQVADLLQAAVDAPFHYQANEAHRGGPLTSPVPWRFHSIDGENCRRLLDRIQSEGVQAGKIANMLAAADALVLTTWLPDPGEEATEFQQFAPTLRNMEHIAGASSAIQNLLLLATAAGWNNYWSSGGVLRSETLYDWTGIDPREVLLGAIFLFPSDTKAATTKPGGNRDQKGPAESWSRWVELE